MVAGHFIASSDVERTHPFRLHSSSIVAGEGLCFFAVANFSTWSHVELALSLVHHLSPDHRWNPVHVPSVPPRHLFPRCWYRKRDELDGPNHCHSHVLPETPHRPLPRGRQTVVPTTVPCHVASGGGGSCGWDGFLACTRGRRRARARARGKEPCSSAARWACALETFPIQPPRACTRAQSGNRTVRANVDSWWMPRSKMDK